ncbi:hypothetical protein RM53_04155 [Brevundimonas nasdae]|uniref:Uncharacterized protein n=1 Tax=Brevundimonas nasdae TaxID=172043 RepID=A0A0B4E223_9CAUL|nr:hypothetical protein [Brevundimonas nasdae]KIC60633.1 hypothetical protein RM53_04155 [Brevundimonas nasdae]
MSQGSASYRMTLACGRLLMLDEITAVTSRWNEALAASQTDEQTFQTISNAWRDMGAFISRAVFQNAADVRASRTGLIALSRTGPSGDSSCPNADATPASGKPATSSSSRCSKLLIKPVARLRLLTVLIRRASMSSEPNRTD